MRRNLFRILLPLSCLAALIAPVVAQQGRDLKREPATTAGPVNSNSFANRWALVVGVSSYKNIPPQSQLRYAHRDAQEFASFLRSEEGGALPADHIKLLVNEGATLASIRAALTSWLPQSAGQGDMVYVFFAGHGVVAEREEGYFVAHDSDPQNLHATGLAFQEMNQVLTTRLKAATVVLVADACHAGRIGWTSSGTDSPGKTSQMLESLGGGDRSFLKLLASRSSERSYEDERWSGGHGVFTFALLEGLRGNAERDKDGVVRAGELIDYMSQIVPEQTRAQQHPRVAGSFEARMVLASLRNGNAMVGPVQQVPVDIQGPAGASVYIDDVFRGAIRQNGTLRIPALGVGNHRISADLPDGSTFDRAATITNSQTSVDLNARPAEGATPLLSQMNALARQGKLYEQNGVWDLYQSRSASLSSTDKAAAEAFVQASLEEAGQACVSDYVQSTVPGVKRVLLERSVESYRRLRQLRPQDREYLMKLPFCEARLAIAQGRYQDALNLLKQALQVDPNFACAYNAMGVAHTFLQHPDDAHKAFEKAVALTPEWALPYLQLAKYHLARNEPEKAWEYLDKSVRFNPKSIDSRWSLLRLSRVLNRNQDFERQAVDLLTMNPNYAPAYLEVGQFFESQKNYAKAADAFDTYLLLAPNYRDSDEIRQRSQKLRSQTTTRVEPSLKNKKDKKDNK